ncbi:hypothetical protein KAU33_09055 [Candidatus Dependentiae bacterium]|nr:hypothetical protein [Candidatus Dependentiae bacterium]
MSTYNWSDLEIGQEILVYGIEYTIVLKTIEKLHPDDINSFDNRGVLYVESPHNNERVIVEMQEDGSFKFMLNSDWEPTKRSTSFSPELMFYRRWDDEKLEKAIEEMNEPFAIFKKLMIWNDKMKCSHRTKGYKVFIDGEDNIVRVRFECVKGCLTDWFEVGKIPLPHNHEMAVIKAD